MMVKLATTIKHLDLQRKSSV